jgi:hypothetical protein
MYAIFAPYIAQPSRLEGVVLRLDTMIIEKPFIIVL